MADMKNQIILTVFTDPMMGLSYERLYILVQKHL